MNVFSHLSYEGRVDLDKLESVDERKAATSTLHNFGLVRCPAVSSASPY